MYFGEILRISWVYEISLLRFSEFHEPVKYKELGGHLSGRVVEGVSDSMEEFGKLFDSDHLSENEPELIELIVGDIILSCDQLGLYSLQWVCQQFC